MNLDADSDNKRAEAVRPGTGPHADKRPPARSEEKEHEGATEDEVTPITPPSGPEFNDEPKQG